MKSLLNVNALSERVAHDPWKLLVAVMFLNKTAGKVAIPIMWDVLSRWPTPEAMSTGMST